MRDRHLDLRWLRYQAGLRESVLSALRNFSTLFRETAEMLHANGTYHRQNEGQFYFGLTHLNFVDKVGRPCRASVENERTTRIFNTARRQALGTLSDEIPETETLPLSAFFTDASLGS